MSGTTPRFGLNWFDGDSQPGTLSDDGQKYTGDDRLLLDRLLSAIENHDHSDPDSTDPSPTPDAVGLSLTSGSGALEAGKAYFYRVSFVDRQGTETPASDEASIDTPDKLPAPAAPSATTDPGGTLPAGLYFYALTAVRGIEETPLGEPVSVTVLVGEGQVTLTPPSLGDASAFYVWRMNDADGQWTRFSSTISFGDFVDDGSSTPTPRNPPSVNTGTSNYSVSVALSYPDQATVQNFAGWKIYRTTTSGTYGGNSLVEKVTTRTVDSDPTSPLVTSFLDVGDALLPGSPPPINQGTKMRFVKQRLAIVTELPTDLSAYPQGFPLILVDGSTLKFYVLHGTDWELVGGGGSSAFPISATLPDPATFEAGSPYVLVNGLGLHLYVTNGYSWTVIGEPPMAGPVISTAAWIAATGTGYTTVDVAPDEAVFVPLSIERATSISSLGIEVTSATAGGSLHLAVFAEAPGTGKPGMLLADFGSVALDSPSWVEVAGYVPALAQRAWLFCSPLGSGTAHVRGVVGSAVSLGFPSTDPGSTSVYGSWSATGVSSLPSDASDLTLQLSETVPSMRAKAS